jgi:hypothetical protein
MSPKHIEVGGLYHGWYNQSGPLGPRCVRRVKRIYWCDTHYKEVSWFSEVDKLQWIDYEKVSGDRHSPSAGRCRLDTFAGQWAKTRLDKGLVCVPRKVKWTLPQFGFATLGLF